MSIDEKLEPCPFCGDMPDGEVAIHNSIKPDTFLLYCCYVRIEKQTKAEAIKAWNQRQGVPALLAEIDKQKEVSKEAVIMSSEANELIAGIHKGGFCCDFLQVRVNRFEKAIKELTEDGS